MFPHAICNAYSTLWRPFLALAAAALPTMALALPVGPTDGHKPKPPEKTPHFSVYSYRGETPQGPAEGVGLYATSRDRAIDLTSPDRTLEGPSGSLFNQAAGIGWRSHNMSAMVGYMKPSSVRSATQFSHDDAPAFRPRARFGVGWSLHF